MKRTTWRGQRLAERLPIAAKTARDEAASYAADGDSMGEAMSLALAMVFEAAEVRNKEMER